MEGQVAASHRTDTCKSLAFTSFLSQGEAELLAHFSELAVRIEDVAKITCYTSAPSSVSLGFDVANRSNVDRCTVDHAVLVTSSGS